MQLILCTNQKTPAHNCSTHGMTSPPHDDYDDDDVNCDSGGNTSVNNKHTLLKTPGDKNG
jgi:hypothetical protein